MEHEDVTLRPDQITLPESGLWTKLPLIGGVLGSLLAIPLTASVKVLFRRYIWEMKFQRELEREQDDPDGDEEEESHASQPAQPPAKKGKAAPKKKGK